MRFLGIYLIIMRYLICLTIIFGFISVSNAGLLESFKNYGKPYVSGCLYNYYGEKVDCWKAYYKNHTEIKKYENWCLDYLWKVARSHGGGLEEEWTVLGCLSSEGPY